MHWEGELGQRFPVVGRDRPETDRELLHGAAEREG